MIINTEPSNKKSHEVKINRITGYLGDNVNYNMTKNDIETSNKEIVKGKFGAKTVVLIASLIYFFLVFLLSHWSGSNVNLTILAATVLYPGFLSLFFGGVSSTSNGKNNKGE